jgi:hypothetical protein
VTVSLLIGALPAVYIGARLSAQAPAAVLRCVIAAVLAGSALALLKVPSPTLVGASIAAAFAMAVICRPARPRSVREVEAVSGGSEAPHDRQVASASVVSAEPASL